jgi:hypothetical protein
MTYQEDQHNQAKSDMLGEFNKAILDAEKRRKAATEAAGDDSAAARENAQATTESHGSNPAGATAVGPEAADTARNCVRHVPWPAGLTNWRSRR